MIATRCPGMDASSRELCAPLFGDHGHAIYELASHHARMLSEREAFVETPGGRTLFCGAREIELNIRMVRRATDGGTA
jgi:hypothetical protein